MSEIKFGPGVFAQAIVWITINIINTFKFHRHSKLKDMLLNALRSINTADLDTKIPKPSRTAPLQFADYYASQFAQPAQFDPAAWFHIHHDEDDPPANDSSSSSSSSSTRNNRRSQAAAQTPSGQPKQTMSQHQITEFMNNFNTATREVLQERQEMFQIFSSTATTLQPLLNDIRGDSRFLEYQNQWDVISLIDLIRILAMRCAPAAASDALIHAMSLKQAPGQTVYNYNQLWIEAIHRSISLGTNMDEPAIRQIFSNSYLDSLLPAFTLAVQDIKRKALAANTITPKITDLMTSMEKEAQVLGLDREMPPAAESAPTAPNTVFKAAAEPKGKEKGKAKETEPDERPYYRRYRNQESQALVLLQPKYQNDPKFQNRIQEVIQDHRPPWRRSNGSNVFITDPEELNIAIAAVNQHRVTHRQEQQLAKIHEEIQSNTQKQAEENMAEYLKQWGDGCPF